MNYLKNMTAQEVFDKVVTHLVNQVVPSMLDDEETCAYRGESGLMCAAGCLIPDEYYKYGFEYQAWEGLVNQNLVPSEHCDLIINLQWEHDNRRQFDTVFMRDRFQNLAKRHELDSSILETLSFKEES